jgi:hypothetical protein
LQQQLIANEKANVFVEERCLWKEISTKGREVKMKDNYGFIFASQQKALKADFDK